MPGTITSLDTYASGCRGTMGRESKGYQGKGMKLLVMSERKRGVVSCNTGAASRRSNPNRPQAAHTTARPRWQAGLPMLPTQQGTCLDVAHGHVGHSAARRFALEQHHLPARAGARGTCTHHTQAERGWHPHTQMLTVDVRAQRAACTCPLPHPRWSTPTPARVAKCNRRHPYSDRCSALAGRLGTPLYLHVLDVWVGAILHQVLNALALLLGGLLKLQNGAGRQAEACRGFMVRGRLLAAARPGAAHKTERLTRAAYTRRSVMCSSRMKLWVVKACWQRFCELPCSGRLRRGGWELTMGRYSAGLSTRAEASSGAPYTG